jgi:PDDEXK-like domain of unknown function (DUF3799)
MTETTELDAATIEDGIYFDLDEDIHHGVRALGSSHISSLLVSPATFWAGSWLNPQKEEQDDDSTKAQILGRAYHVARLEPQRFHQTYARKPVKSDFPAKDLLTSDAAVKAALKDAGLTQAIGTETFVERCDRLFEAGFKGKILPYEVAKFEETLGGRIPIEGERFDEIVIDMQRIEAQPDVAQHLRGGFSEVSVFWTGEDGVRRKVRFDHLQVGEWADLKTFDNKNRKDVRQAITDSFRYNRYYVQAAHYRDGYDQIQSGKLPVRGEASEEQRAMIAVIVDRKAPPQCWYVFQEKGGVPNLFARQFMFTALDAYREHEIELLMSDPNKKELVKAAMSETTQIYRKGKIEISRAIALFRMYCDVYEAGEPWAPVDPIGRIEDADFNRFWLEEA